MENEGKLVPSKTLEEKLKDRVRESIGELLSDEDLSKIIEKGIHETFFKERSHHIGYRTEYKEPLITEVIEDVLKSQVSQMVANYMANNKELSEHIAKIFQERLGDAIIQGVIKFFFNEISNFKFAIADKLRIDLDNG